MTAMISLSRLSHSRHACHASLPEPANRRGGGDESITLNRTSYTNIDCLFDAEISFTLECFIFIGEFG